MFKIKVRGQVCIRTSCNVVVTVTLVVFVHNCSKKMMLSLRKWARTWIEFFAIRFGWNHPKPLKVTTASYRCSRIHTRNIIGDSELDLINMPTKNPEEPDHPCFYEFYELSLIGEESVHKVIIDAARNKNLIFVARRSRDASATIPILFSSSKIEQVVLLQCSINDDDAIKISKAVASGCAKLTSLVMPRNLISSTGTWVLATGLHIHGGVQCLDLSFNQCGDKGAECLAFLVLKSKSLRVLRLRGNCIQSRGAVALANALIQRQFSTPRTMPYLRSLDKLDLACNDIGDGGAYAFSAVVRLNCALRALDISHNSITIAGARRLSSAMEKNRTLDSLLVGAVARSRGEQSELTALQLRHACGPGSDRCARRPPSPMAIEPHAQPRPQPSIRQIHASSPCLSAHPPAPARCPHPLARASHADPVGRRLDPERALAFAMGLHRRLGWVSPARRLDDALARHVLHDLAAAAAVPRRVALCVRRSWNF